MPSNQQQPQQTKERQQNQPATSQQGTTKQKATRTVMASELRNSIIQQREQLISLDVHEDVFGLTADQFRAKITEEVERNVPTSLEVTQGNIPAVLVLRGMVPTKLVALASKNETNGAKEKFERIRTSDELFDLPQAYAMWNVEPGKATHGFPPANAMTQIESQRRSGQTFEENLFVALFFPDTVEQRGLISGNSRWDEGFLPVVARNVEEIERIRIGASGESDLGTPSCAGRSGY